MKRLLLLACLCAAAGAAEPTARPTATFKVSLSQPAAGATTAAAEPEPVPTAAAPEPAPAAEWTPRLLATIGDQTITERDVNDEMWRWRGAETLEWLIGRQLLREELARMNLTVDEADVDARMREHLAGLQQIFGNLDNPDDLTMSAAGMRAEEYRERTVWTELALRAIMHKAMPPAESELRAWFAETRAQYVRPEDVLVSHIFAAPPDGPDGVPGPREWAMAEQKILAIHARLRSDPSTDNFRDTAQEFGAVYTQRRVRRGELLRELEDAAFALSPGSISSPLRTGMGFHILYTLEKNRRREPEFGEVRDKVCQSFEEKRFAASAGDYLRTLRRRAIDAGRLRIEATPGAPLAGGAW